MHLVKPISCALLGLLSLTWAFPVLAAPTLFSGSIRSQGGGGTANFCAPGYGITLPHGPCSVQTGTASVTGSGSFTVPQSTFVFSATYGETFPGYPFFTAYLDRRNTAAGSFGPSYLTPGTTITLYANETTSPMVLTTPRMGFLRLKVGANGFGGKMLFYFEDAFTYTAAGSLGAYLDFNVLGKRLRGVGPLGATNPNAADGGIQYASLTLLGEPLEVTFAGGSTRGPWITGVVTAFESHGSGTATFSTTGSDNRTTATMGTIALVTPNLLFRYVGIGGTVQKMRNGFASTSKLTMNFLPEPASGAQLSFGLAALALWIRRRRTRM